MFLAGSGRYAKSQDQIKCDSNHVCRRDLGIVHHKWLLARSNAGYMPGLLYYITVMKSIRRKIVKKKGKVKI